MKISSGGIGAVASGALAAAGSNIGGKRYLWAWDFSEISVAARANTFYANTGWHDGPSQGDEAPLLDLPPEHGWGVSYTQAYAHQILQSHAEGLFTQTAYNWSSGRGTSSGPALTAWTYNQFNRDDGQPHKMSGELDAHKFSSGKYFHIILKTKGFSSPIYEYKITGRGDVVQVASEADVGTIFKLTADEANTTVAGFGVAGSGIGWVTGAGAGNPQSDSGGPGPNDQFDGITYKELEGSDGGLGAFSLIYSSSRYGESPHESAARFNATATFVSGDYRTIVWDLGEASTQDIFPRYLQFKLFNDGDSTAGNPHHYGSANVSYIVCGMVLADEILSDIPLPIDIHRTLG